MDKKMYEEVQKIQKIIDDIIVKIEKDKRFIVRLKHDVKKYRIWQYVFFIFVVIIAIINFYMFMDLNKEVGKAQGYFGSVLESCQDIDIMKRDIQIMNINRRLEKIECAIGAAAVKSCKAMKHHYNLFLKRR